MSTSLHIDDIGNLILRDGKFGLFVSSQNATPPHYGGGRVGALSPYVYCADNPVNYGDYNGMSITVVGDSAAMVVSFYNQGAGRDVFSYDAKTKQVVYNESDNPNEYEQIIADIVKSTKEVVLKAVYKDSKTLIGDVLRHKVDVFDMKNVDKYGRGSSFHIPASQLILHETVEQNEIAGTSPTIESILQAHNKALDSESSLFHSGGKENIIMPFYVTSLGLEPKPINSGVLLIRGSIASLRFLYCNGNIY